MYFDFVIIGGGLSGSWFLKEFLENTGPTMRSATVAIIDSPNKTFGGSPYGDTADDSYLLMNPDDELAQTPYLEWCLDRGVYERRQSRRLFGRFLDEAVNEAIGASPLSVKRMYNRVVGFKPDGVGGYGLRLDSGQEIAARGVLLALGSAPNRSIPNLVGFGGYINDLYAAGWAQTEQRIVAALSKSAANRDVILLGTNAAGSESVYCAAQSPAILDLADKFIAISGTGEFPNGGRSGRIPYEAAYLADQAIQDALALIVALENDMNAALAQGYTTLDCVMDTRSVFFARFMALSNGQKVKFATQYAQDYKRITRRSPPEYADVIEALKTSGKLISKAARVDLDGIAHDGEVCLVPLVDGTSIEARIIVNCLGAVPLVQSDDPLICQLVRRYGVNGSGHGFKVSPQFEMDSNLFVLGPMLAGYSQPDDSIWHLESIPRIVKYAKTLARTVLSRNIFNTERF